MHRRRRLAAPKERRANYNEVETSQHSDFSTCAVPSTGNAVFNLDAHEINAIGMKLLQDVMADVSAKHEFDGTRGYSQYSSPQDVSADSERLKGPPMESSHTVFNCNKNNSEEPVAFDVLTRGGRFSERSVNYRSLVAKILHNNDQPASLLLQQKLKGPADPAQRGAIFEAVAERAVALMCSKFGNFLVQKYFECGTRDQMGHLTQEIKTHILSISTDRYGSHVVQKAIETIEDESKMVLVQEMLRLVPETLTNQFACHCWQRIFEIKWRSLSPSAVPPVLEQVKGMLRGRWHDIANDEHGSLVVQSVFEHCHEVDKREILNEVRCFCYPFSRRINPIDTLVVDSKSSS
ncbi:hypothetical protein HDU93_000989 [Gonapodya sp. JEL0774]|nr:hypothetical protein HDU93_000989 [Gonapodya sp. JEL0774]